MRYLHGIHRALLLCICLCATVGIYGQQVTITGTAPFAPKEEIRLSVINDLIYNIPELVATDMIDKNGHFSLKCKIDRITIAQLSIRTTKAEFLLVPGYTYQFNVDVDTTLFNLLHPETYGGYLLVSNPNADTNDLNTKINRFDDYFGRAFDHYGFRIIYDKDISAFDTLTELISNRYGLQYEPDNFYLSHIYYAYGMVEKMCFPNDRKRIYEHYFDNDKILYNNPAYMALFTNYYTGYLYNSKYISKDLLTETINEKPDYLTLFNQAGRDPMMVNERIRELVIILNLIELYNNPEFDKGNIVSLLQYLSKVSHFPDHQIYINHALEKMTTPNSSIQPLTFTNSKGRQESIKHLGNKPIYIHLFSTDCIDCIRELMYLKELHNKFGEHMQFLSICIDPRESGYKAFMQEYGKMFDWPIWYFNHNYEWLERNQIETMPDYMIADELGNITLRRAPSPEKGLYEYLQALFPDEEQDDSNPLFQRKNNN